MKFRGFALAITLIDLITNSQSAIRTSRLRYRRIKIRNGYIRGVTIRFPSDTHLRNVDTYLGVDYGSLKRNFLFRFLPASNVIPNKKADFLDSTAFKGVCPQPVQKNVIRSASVYVTMEEYLKAAMTRSIQTEDCLSLNVYAFDKGKE